MSQCCGFIIRHAAVWIAKQGSEIILHKGLTESANTGNATKFTESASSGKAIAIN